MNSITYSNCLFFCLLFFVLPFGVASPNLSAQEHNDEQKYTNALAKESSPYLLMHARNPVNWYPWNEEALQKAKDEGKAIFLSIGYSSCHWCHVMERESFLDEEIAKFLNENFICIKVDREERPDVDQIYMESLNIFNRLTKNGQGGGWPLSMFLTPEGKPFFGGTYFPARDGDRQGRPGFLTVAKKVDENWRNNNETIRKSADQLTEYTRQELEGQPAETETEIDPAWSTKCLDQLSGSYDPEYGGYGFSATNPNRPKFPQPANLMFLSQFASGDAPDERAKSMFIKTCEMMEQGGIYDHVGSGFHRYSVDRYWGIPHFEKMLYDNGQLATVYCEAYKLEPRESFKRTVEGILHFVESEMLAPGGGFYSSLDAESEGEEGKFYRWDLDEIKKLLTDDEYKTFAEIYRLNEAPNFEEKHYAPQLKIPLSEHAKRLSVTETELETSLVSMRKKLFDARSKRIRPLLDNKILTSWNGMMIRGFADAGRVFKNQQYHDVAAKAADFALQNLKTKEGRLWRTHTDGESKLNAYLIDYACLIEGLLALHRADGSEKWLDEAKSLQAKQDELFWDEKSGGYFYTSSDHQTLLVRSKQPADNAVPAGNSIAACNLVYLAKATGEGSYKKRADKTVLSVAGLLKAYPVYSPRLLRAAEAMKELK
jgi:uncharacterized protein YyaL (SSP411 family)